MGWDGMMREATKDVSSYLPQTVDTVEIQNVSRY